MNYALLCSCKRSDAKECPSPLTIPNPYDAFLRRGNLLPSRNERSEVKGGDIALLYEQSVAGLGVNFTNLPSNLTKYRKLNLTCDTKYYLQVF